MTTAEELKKFGLNDDQILEIAILVDEEGMMPACKRMQAYIFDKWNMPLNVAADTVRALRKELGCGKK